MLFRHYSKVDRKEATENILMGNSSDAWEFANPAVGGVVSVPKSSKGRNSHRLENGKLFLLPVSRLLASLNHFSSNDMYQEEVQ